MWACLIRMHQPHLEIRGFTGTREGDFLFVSNLVSFLGVWHCRADIFDGNFNHVRMAVFSVKFLSKINESMNVVILASLNSFSFFHLFLCHIIKIA